MKNSEMIFLKGAMTLMTVALFVAALALYPPTAGLKKPKDGVRCGHIITSELAQIEIRDGVMTNKPVTYNQPKIIGFGESDCPDGADVRG